MTVVGLFAGIGGFELAFSKAGFETQMLVEIDPEARAVLGTRFPAADLKEDVQDLRDLPSGTKIVTAGFPCQNLSMAGDKSGIQGSKSGVVAKMFDLVARSKTPIVVIENVYFMLHLDRGRGMTWLVKQFERLGYHWAYRVVDTMGFGLPHRRRRVYLVATREIDPRSVLFADESPPLPKPRPGLDRPLGFYWTEGRSGIGITVDGIPPLKVGSAVGIRSAPAVLFPEGEVTTPGLSACERLQGFDAGWTTSDTYPKRTRGARWRLVGNAISVPVARWVADRIKSPGEIKQFETQPLQNGEAWPDACWNVGDGRIRVSATDKPLCVLTPSISEFRDESWERLSERALSGFIARAQDGGLRMPRGFIKALKTARRATPSRGQAVRRQ